jgi:PAS domain S-box-containing protein
MIGKGKNTNEYAAGEMAAWYKEIVDNSHDLIQCVDSEGKLVYVNQSWLSTLNYSAEEIESITLWDIIHPDSMEHCMTVFQQVIAGKAVGKVEAIFVAKDGTPVLVEGNVGLKLDEDGRFIYTRGIFRDVSEQKQANEEILKRDAMLQKIFDLLPVGLWFADEKGKLLRGNPEGVRIWGGEPHVDQSDYGVFKAWRLPSGEEIAPDDWALAHTVNEGITVADEMLEIEDLKGQKKIVLNYTAPVVDDKGKIQGAIVVNQDITVLKQAEEEIRTLNEELEKRVKDRTIQLEAVNIELQSFAYSISHDFRAPLRALNAFSASLIEKYADQLDEQGLHYLKRISNAALYMSDLVDDLLNLSRITRTGIKEQKADISHMAVEILKELSEAEPERRVKVTVEPNLTAKGDLALLKAALENLLGNAWKFSSQEAQAEIEVGLKSTGGEEIFFVRDNGAGFNMAYADKLFGAFQRLHKVGEFPGTGIGLATVQRVINRHGGRIWAESEVGKGATFFFTLP